jgi:hypothetical protein
MITLRALLPAALAPILLGAAAAHGCEAGQVLRPGDSCELTVEWGTDHWIVAEFPDNDPYQVEIEHEEGDCRVSLFAPIETEETILGPDQAVVRRTLEGEYHLFTRAIVVTQQTCRFRISVE